MKTVAKYELVAALLMGQVDKSDREIARTAKDAGVGVSATFVGKVRRYLESNGRLKTVAIRIGKDRRKRHMPRSQQEIRDAEIRRAWRKVRKRLAGLQEEFRRAVNLEHRKRLGIEILALQADEKKLAEEFWIPPTEK